MIPTEFYLGGVKFQTEFNNKFDNPDQLGMSIPALGKIIISPIYRNEIVPMDSQERTFYHELVHTILIELGEHELSSNERLVDSFSALLYQFEITKKL